MESPRSNVRQLAAESWARGDAIGWFEALYAGAQGRAAAVPWADLAPNPNLIDWLQTHPLQGEGKSALVVGCGLGDDAEALAHLGFAVTAFDVAPTAIAWCQQRFPTSAVTYCVANLLTPPPEWSAKFDFVLESYTLQALPETVRSRAIEQVAHCVASTGRLLVICRGREETDPVGDLPFPLTKPELAQFQALGLMEVEFADYLDPAEGSVRRFRVEYQKPSSRQLN
jgi:SAM-dependent methyltransferase